MPKKKKDKKEKKLQSYLVKGTLTFRGEVYVKAEDEQDAQDKFNEGDFSWDNTLELIDWQIEDDPKLNN